MVGHSRRDKKIKPIFVKEEKKVTKKKVVKKKGKKK